MSEKAYVDPVRLEDFAHSLQDFAAGVDKATDRLLMQLGSLGKTWQDPGYQEFEPEVKRLVIVLLRFVEESQQFSSHLLDRAESARQIHKLDRP